MRVRRIDDVAADHKFALVIEVDGAVEARELARVFAHSMVAAPTLIDACIEALSEYLTPSERVRPTVTRYGGEGPLTASRIRENMEAVTREMQVLQPSLRNLADRWVSDAYFGQAIQRTHQQDMATEQNRARAALQRQLRLLTATERL